MLNMQAFHQLLCSTAKASDPRRDHLVHLTRVNRDQISALTSGLGWDIWSDDQGGGAPQ